ncbi:hypothetical protein CEP54_007203 [Fusarium duplospermum]|uniref:Uncharacterized protein n=1 Tax=Fusarium duplospermum TaxID=1325734 RepID=A0A428Q349_9HYPO|nr:hypothetical protein CEP54_007203 [Fusarium duplospermum]
MATPTQIARGPLTAAWLSLDLTKSQVAHPPRRWHLGRRLEEPFKELAAQLRRFLAYASKKFAYREQSPITRRRDRVTRRLAATRDVVARASLLLGMLTGYLTTNSVDPEKEVDGHFRGREKNIIVNDETKQKHMLLNGAPRRWTPVTEKLADFRSLTSAEVISTNDQPTVGDYPPPSQWTTPGAA